MDAHALIMTTLIPADNPYRRDLSPVAFPGWVFGWGVVRKTITRFVAQESGGADESFADPVQGEPFRFVLQSSFKALDGFVHWLIT